MTRKETKQQAQAELLSAMQIAFAGTGDDDLRAEMSLQMARVEKLFGYDQYSWVRGI